MKLLKEAFLSNKTYQNGSNQVKQSFNLTKKDVQELTGNYPIGTTGYKLVVQTPTRIISLFVIKHNNRYSINSRHDGVLNQIGMVDSLDQLVNFISNLK